MAWISLITVLSVVIRYKHAGKMPALHNFHHLPKKFAIINLDRHFERKIESQVLPF